MFVIFGLFAGIFGFIAFTCLTIPGKNSDLQFLILTQLCVMVAICAIGANVSWHLSKLREGKYQAPGDIKPSLNTFIAPKEETKA